METLFSTVAQISFTILGLFFVVLTVDSETRTRWFNQNPENHYMRLNFLVMLVPGFLSLGGLINLGEGIFRSWIVASFILFSLSLLTYIQLRKLKKEPGYKRIANLETRLNISNIALTNAIAFLALSIFGFASSYAHDFIHLAQQEEILKTFVVLSLVDSILPVIVFPANLQKTSLIRK